MSTLITLTGPSQAGKSTAIKTFLDLSIDGFDPVTIPKYTTRLPRPDDSPNEVITCSSLPIGLDLVYQQYDDRYGLSAADIVWQMEQGKTPIIVLNDVRIITEVKRLFGTLVRSVFLYRSPPKREDFEEVAAKRGASDGAKLDLRLKKAEAIYRIYIENIFLFDHVILNTSSKKNLRRQITAIARSGRPSTPALKDPKKNAKYPE